VQIIQTKINAGVYERSNSSYRSRWFTVLKKGGTLLRIVHSLEPLNTVTIQHSGVPPFTEQLPNTSQAVHVAASSISMLATTSEPSMKPREITPRFRHPSERFAWLHFNGLDEFGSDIP